MFESKYWKWFMVIWVVCSTVHTQGYGKTESIFVTSCRAQDLHCRLLGSSARREAVVVKVLKNSMRGPFP